MTPDFKIFCSHNVLSSSSTDLDLAQNSKLRNRSTPTVTVRGEEEPSDIIYRVMKYNYIDNILNLLIDSFLNKLRLDSGDGIVNHGFVDAEGEVLHANFGSTTFRRHFEK